MATAAVPITGMPKALTAAVNRYDNTARRTIVTNWALLGPDERQRYCDEIEHSRPWTRRWRAEVAAAQLNS